MPNYQYKVIPAPSKGTKAKGVKTAEGRFALSIDQVLNQMGEAGWEYLRAELLPSDERSGLTGSTTHWRNVLVFRRVAPGDTEQFQPRLLDPPAEPSAAPALGAAATLIAPADAPPIDLSQGQDNGPEHDANAEAQDPDATRMATGAERMLRDNGVEELSDVAGMTTALQSRAEQQGADEDAEHSGSEDFADSDAETGDETGEDSEDRKN